jgi:LysM repeat protein
MKKNPVPGAMIIMCIGLIVLLTTTPVFAQGQNLLTNPGFEPPFVTAGGEPPREVAQGWTPWHISGGASASENVQPEYCAASDVACGLGIPRIHSANDAQQYHSFFATHDGGVFQRVASGISNGAQLRFSVFAYVWSTSFDDVDESEQDGGVTVRVGIDPTGGTDPTSQNIVWSSPTVEYDTYSEYSVTATARGSAVTVFVRSTVSFPVKNNNIYLDDASLTVVGAQAGTPTSTNTRAATATSTRAATSTPGDLGLITSTATLAPTNTTAPTVTFTLTAPPTTVQATNTPTSPATFTPTSPAPATVATSAPTITATNTQIIAPTFTPTHTQTAPPTFTRPPSVTPTQTSVPPATGTPGAPISSEFPNSIIHVVQPGDTVGRLATLYGSTIAAIIEANGLNQFAFIRVDQRLVIPVRLAAPATSTPTNTPAVVIVVTATPGAPPPATSGNVYVVQPGDTMFRIANRFNTTVAALAQLNGIVNPNIIRVGQRLIVPVPGGNQPATPVPPSPTLPGPTPVLVTPTSGQPPATSVPPTAVSPRLYTVQPGDNLYRISLRFGVPMRTLIQVNGIVDPNRIFVGQRLTIP